MTSFLSSEVRVTETDKSQYTQTNASSYGAAVIAAGWGPVLQPQFIDSENTLVNVFGQPNNDNYKNWISAANFLQYSSGMYVTRMATKNQFTANAKGLTGYEHEIVTSSTGQQVKAVDTNGDYIMNQVGLKINNESEYDAMYSDDSSASSDYGEFAARYPGRLGNSIFVTYADSTTFDNWKYTDPSTGNTFDWSKQFSQRPGTSKYAAARGGSNDEIHLLVVDGGGRITGTRGQILEKYSFLSKASDAVGLDGDSIYYKKVIHDQSSYVYCLTVPGDDAVVPKYDYKVITIDNTSVIDKLEGLNKGDLVIDTDKMTMFVGVNTVSYNDQGVRSVTVTLSESKSLKEMDGVCVYNIKDDSVYQVKVTDQTPTIAKVETTAGFNNWGSQAEETEFTNLKSAYGVQLSGGSDDFDYSDANEITGWDTFGNAETYEISLCVTGACTPTVAKYVITNICEARMDCVAFVSPTTATRGPILGNVTNTDIANGVTTSELKLLNKTLEYRNTELNVNSSYGHLDSGWKYQYDKYNDCNRWVPLNGDCAGLYAKVDDTNYPWTVAAGYNRGQIKNVIKLSYNPSKAHRDQLYPAQINPVVTFTGEGTILYGSKSLLTKPSAFDRLHVRRLFIYLEQQIKESAKYLLFELNNASTRNYAVNIFEPILRYVAGAGGIYSYSIVCDETNNTADIIDQNLMVCTIMVAPAKSIDWIRLDFVCTKTGETTYSES